jgi:hypothetical protein
MRSVYTTCKDPFPSNIVFDKWRICRQVLIRDLTYRFRSTRKVSVVTTSNSTIRLPVSCGLVTNTVLTDSMRMDVNPDIEKPHLPSENKIFESHVSCLFGNTGLVLGQMALSIF